MFPRDVFSGDLVVAIVHTFTTVGTDYPHREFYEVKLQSWLTVLLSSVSLGHNTSCPPNREWRKEWGQEIHCTRPHPQWPPSSKQSPPPDVLSRSSTPWFSHLIYDHLKLWVILRYKSDTYKESMNKWYNSCRKVLWSVLEKLREGKEASHRSVVLGVTLGDMKCRTEDK